MCVGNRTDRSVGIFLWNVDLIENKQSIFSDWKNEQKLYPNGYKMDPFKII